jgi:hypothetical protein
MGLRARVGTEPLATNQKLRTGLEATPKTAPIPQAAGDECLLAGMDFFPAVCGVTADW